MSETNVCNRLHNAKEQAPIYCKKSEIRSFTGWIQLFMAIPYLTGWFFIQNIWRPLKLVETEFYLAWGNSDYKLFWLHLAEVKWKNCHSQSGQKERWRYADCSWLKIQQSCNALMGFLASALRVWKSTAKLVTNASNEMAIRKASIGTLIR